MTARAHLYRPLVDQHGDLITDATVRVLQPGTTDLVTDSLYYNSTDDSILPNPFNVTNGVLDFYMNQAQTVRFGISRPGQAEVFIEDYDVGEPEHYKETFTFTLAGAVTTQQGALRFYIDEACEIVRVRASTGVAPVGANLIVDVNRGNASTAPATLFTDQDTRPQIADGQNTGYVDLATPVALAPDDFLTIDIDQVGSSTSGSNLVVQVRVRRT